MDSCGFSIILRYLLCDINQLRIALIRKTYPVLAYLKHDIRFLFPSSSNSLGIEPNMLNKRESGLKMMRNCREITRISGSSEKIKQA
jgi:hypothetical protein